MKLWLRSRDPGLLALCGIIVAFTVYYGSLTLNIHHGLGTAAYDSGLYDQGMWLLSRFRSPFVTTMGRNLLGDHHRSFCWCWCRSIGLHLEHGFFSGRKQR